MSYTKECANVANRLKVRTLFQILLALLTPPPPIHYIVKTHTLRLAFSYGRHGKIVALC